MKENDKSNKTLESSGTPAEKPEQNIESTKEEEDLSNSVDENRSGVTSNLDIEDPDAPALADASMDSSSLDLEKAPETEVKSSVPQTGPEIEQGKEEIPQENFQPFYEKEARAEARVRAVKSISLYFLLGVLGLTLIGLALDALLRETLFWLEATTTTLICFILIGFLWKTITLETKVGLEALAVSVIAATAVLFYSQTDLGLSGFIPGGFVLPGMFALALAAVLTAVWLVWPRLFWAPLLMTAVVLYAGLAPALALSLGGTDLNSLILGPPGMESWPIFFRAGYVTVQVVLPLGFVLLLVLQVHTLFNRRYRTHWGFLYWALSLSLVGVIGLVGLDRNRQPVFPPLADLAARVVSVEMAEKSGTPAVPSEVRPQTTIPEQPAPAQEPATPAPSIPPAETPKESEQKPAESTPSIQKEEQKSEEAISPSAAPPQTESEIADLKTRIETLEAQIKELNQRLEVQDELLKAIMNYIGAESGKPSPPETYEPNQREVPGTEPEEGETEKAPPERPSLRPFQEYT